MKCEGVKCEVLGVKEGMDGRGEEERISGLHWPFCKVWKRWERVGEVRMR